MSEDGKAKMEATSAMWTTVSREALVAGSKDDGRTVYRREAKARLIAAATAPGASVARIAREHDLNANQLHSWIRAAKHPAPKTGSRARLSVNVGAGMERAAKLRTEATRGREAKLLPVAITPTAASPEAESSSKAAPITLAALWWAPRAHRNGDAETVSQLRMSGSPCLATTPFRRRRVGVVTKPRSACSITTSAAPSRYPCDFPG